MLRGIIKLREMLKIVKASFDGTVTKPCQFLIMQALSVFGQAVGAEVMARSRGAASAVEP